MWASLGRPPSFVVAEVGAGPGTLARTINAAAPRCGDALTYFAVERGPLQREQHPDWVTSIAEVGDLDGEVSVVLANELLDNLAFDVYERHDGAWHEVRVGETAGELVEVLVPADPDLPDAPNGVRLPLCVGARRWIADALDAATSRLLLFDYCTPIDEMIAADESRWIRTYRGNEVGTHPLDAPGSQDITTQVPLDQITTIGAPAVSTQADFLRRCGIEELVAEGKKVWAERAHIGDLVALKARSRIAESEALLAPDGLGAFTVLEFRLDG